MVKLSKEILEDISKQKIFPLSTCSLDHIPNVVPIGIFEVDTSNKDKDYIYIMDNFYLKTMKNILENPNVAFYIWSFETKYCTQIKGKVISIVDEGENFLKFKNKYLSIISNLPCRHLLKIEITNIFNCTSGPDAGKQLL